jgi:hypothetical protein
MSEQIGEGSKSEYFPHRVGTLGVDCQIYAFAAGFVNPAQATHLK